MKTTYTATEVGPLQGLDQIEDTRYQPFVEHTLPEIIFLLISASLSYCDTIAQMIVFGHEKVDWLRKYFPYKNGVPSHDTIGRVLGMIDAPAFETWFRNWVIANFELNEEEQLAFDGKRLVGSANKTDQSKRRDEGGSFAKIVVNVFATGAGLVLAQQDVSRKIDEVDGARQLINSLEIKGCCVSGDNNFCSRDLLDLIIERGADYLITLKGKSPKLHNAVKAAFADETLPKAICETEDRGHGRVEKRTYRSLPVDSLPESVTKSYRGLQQVIEVRRQRTVGQAQQAKTTVHTHYYITSKGEDLARIAKLIRNHWAVENNLHWVLDVSYGEDSSRARRGNLAVNFSLIRKCSLNLVKKLSGTGITQRRLRAILSDEYRDQVFKNPMR